MLDVVVTDGGCLAPDGAPRLVLLLGFFINNRETVHEVSLLQSTRGVLVLSQLEAEVGRQHYCPSLVSHFIRRAPFLVNRELQFDISIR